MQYANIRFFQTKYSVYIGEVLVVFVDVVYCRVLHLWVVEYAATIFASPAAHVCDWLGQLDV